LTTIDVVIPVLNEERALRGSVESLREYLAAHCPHEWRVMVADNGSTDRTPDVCASLAHEYTDVTYVRLEQRGRGRALRQAWSSSTAGIIAYMDVDLSTNLGAFMPLIEPLLDGTTGVAIGSRLLKGARVTRQWKREVISRLYNLLILILFPRKGFTDAQCGFKAITRRVADEIVPLIKDQAWFFDTELLLRARQAGYRIHEVPVEWIEDLDSRVKIAKTAWEDVKGLVRVRLTPFRRAALTASPTN
jgi:glycosyltransferase involved in cell wall biosynthesis